MHILYITNGFPYPLTSGYLRHYFLIKELSRQHRITLLSIVGANFVDAHVDALRPFTEDVRTFVSSTTGRSRREKAINWARSLIGTTPVDEAAVQMRAAIADLAGGTQYDAVLLSGKRTFPVLEELDGTPIIADMCDATSMRIRGQMEHAELVRLPILLRDYMEVRRVEQLLIQRASRLLFASCRDREALLGSADDHAAVVPNGVDLDFWSRSTPKRGRNTIVLTGGMDYPPNTDAALFLIEEIFPLVRRSVPTARLLIVGRDPTEELRRAGQRDGVTVTGFVDDVRPYMEQATVFVAPLRFGAGIQNKVLEALAMEVPVIASSLAADGLRTEEGQQPPIQVAKTAQQFAKHIVHTLSTYDDDPTPHEEGRRFVENHFVWTRSGERLNRVLNAIVENGGL